VPPLRVAIEALLADPQDVVLARSILGTDDGGVIAGRVEAFVQAHLGRSIDGVATPVALEELESPVTVVESTLPDDTTQQALECMLNGIEGTSFAQTPPYGGPSFGFYQSVAVGRAAE